LNLGSNAVIAWLVYTYVHKLQGDAHFHFFGVSLAARESLLLLVLFVGFMIMAMLALATSEYVSRAAALKLHRRYEEYSVERSLRLLQLLPDARCPQVATIIQNVGVNRLVKTFPHSCSWSLRFIGGAFPSLVVFVAGYSALLWLDFKTTLLVTALGVGVILAQYPIHLLAARSSNIVEETGSYVSQKLANLMAFVSGFGVGTAMDRRGLEARLDEYARDDRVKRSGDAEEDRFRAMELSALSMQTGGGIVLGAMLLTVGSGLLSDSANWAVLMVYVTLLRRLLNGVTSVFRAITMFSRYSPHVQVYRSFVQGAALAAIPATSPPVAPEHLSVDVRDPEGTPNILRLRKGERCALFSASGLDRELAIAVQRALFEGRRASTDPMPQIRAVAVAAPECPKSKEAALQAAYLPGAVLLLDHWVVATLSAPRRSFWLERLSDSYVVPVYPSAMEPHLAETAALVRDRAYGMYGLSIPPAGLGAEQLSAIDELMKSGQQASAKAAALEEDME
jgi:ABC-type multidrug transport system fused ATPase/permease subunit